MADEVGSPPAVIDPAAPAEGSPVSPTEVKRPRSILNSPNAAQRRSRKGRPGQPAIEQPIPPGSIEPDLRQLPGRKHPGRFARDVIAFAIIARALALNQTDEQILAELKATNRETTPRTLEEVKGRSDFLEYYRRFRENIFHEADERMRGIFSANVVKAALKIVKIMQEGRRFDSRSESYVDDEKLQFEAAVQIVKESRAGVGGPTADAPAVPVNIQIALLQKGRSLVPARTRVFEGRAEPSQPEPDRG